MSRAEELIDEDDWIEVERASPAAQPLADVTVKVSFCAPGRFKAAPKARVFLAFRGDAAKWLVENGPRFRVQLGGANVNYIRITPDLQLGKFEVSEPTRAGTRRLNLGQVTAWPAEERALTAAEWSVDRGFMRLKLPEDFAKPTVKQPAPPSKVAALTPPPKRSDPDRTSNTVIPMGEPAPGRSALAQRRGAA